MEGRPSYCPQCGSKLDGFINFCPNCGARLPELQTSEAAVNTENPQPIYDPQAAYSGRPKKESVGLTIVGIISFGLAAVALYFVIAFFFRYDASATIDEETTVALIHAPYAVMGTLYLILLITGVIGGIICLKKNNYDLGMAMYIISIVACCLTVLFSFEILTIMSVVIAVVLLVIYVKNKSYFEI